MAPKVPFCPGTNCAAGYESKLNAPICDPQPTETLSWVNLPPQSLHLAGLSALGDGGSVGGRVTRSKVTERMPNGSGSKLKS